MPVDVDAEVIENARLSADYNVIKMSAPEIAASARPGQFVMLRPQAGLDPMLRRPFSIFEILRGPAGEPVGHQHAQQAHRPRHGRSSTRSGLAIGSGAWVHSASRSCRSRRRQRAWMVAGGVGLAPFASLGEALAARGTPTTLFYGARSAA